MSFGTLSFVEVEIESFDESEFGDAASGIFAFCTGVGNENSGVTVSPHGSLVYLTNPFFGTVAR